MVEIELKSKELKEFVYLTLDKDRSTPIYDEDLDQIKDVTLDGLDLLDEPTDATILDLIFFTSLETCMIADKVISESEVEVLNKLESIKTIQFTNCIFSKGKKIKCNATYLIVDGCKYFDANVFNEMKCLTKLCVVNCENVNLVGKQELNELKNVYLQNLELNDINDISNLKKIEYLNLNGTKVKNMEEIIKNKNIKIEHEERNYIYDVEN